MTAGLRVLLDEGIGETRAVVLRDGRAQVGSTYGLDEVIIHSRR